MLQQVGRTHLKYSHFLFLKVRQAQPVQQDHPVLPDLLVMMGRMGRMGRRQVLEHQRLRPVLSEYLQVGRTPLRFSHSVFLREQQALQDQRVQPQVLERQRLQPDQLGLPQAGRTRLKCLHLAFQQEIPDQQDRMDQQDHPDQQGLPVLPVRQVAQDRKVWFGKAHGLHLLYLIKWMMQYITIPKNLPIFVFKPTLHPALYYQLIPLIGRY